MEQIIIDKVLSDIIEKCSNKEIHAKLANMSSEEKKSLLNDKMNPFEKHEYDSLLDDLEFWESIANDEKQSTGSIGPNTDEELKKIKEKLFFYDKRIIRGYDLEKYIDKVPPYNLKDFKEEKSRENASDDIYELEQSQLDYQEKHMFIDGKHILEDDECNALRSYFGKKSGQINSELSPKKYKMGLWEQLPSNIKKDYHENNNVLIPLISKSISKSPGLEVDTVLYHGVQDSHLVDIHSRIGDNVRLNSFISTSYDKNIGMNYGEDIGNSKRLYVKFLTPKKTNGICANDNNVQLTDWKGEHEYLLDKGNKGTIVDIDYNTGEVTVLLDG